MTIAFKLTVLRWHLGSFDVHIDIDHGVAAEMPEPVIDRAVKRISRRYFRSMTS